MIPLGDIFRRYGPAYRAAHGTQLSADQITVMHAIEACRTATLGGHLYRCPQCATITYSYHLRFHPHIHYLVPGGGLAPDGRTWKASKSDFFVHVKPLAVLFRAKLRAALRQTPLWRDIPAEVWQQDWVVDCRPVGSGGSALKYLAPYVFRVALSNNRILRVQDDQVTFRYQDGKTRQTRTCTLPADAFIQRFLQNVLPKGFVKVRYFGLFRVGTHKHLARLQAQLQLQQRAPHWSGTAAGTGPRHDLPPLRRPHATRAHPATPTRPSACGADSLTRGRQRHPGLDLRHSGGLRLRHIGQVYPASGRLRTWRSRIVANAG